MKTQIQDGAEQRLDSLISQEVWEVKKEISLPNNYLVNGTWREGGGN